MQKGHSDQCSTNNRDYLTRTIAAAAAVVVAGVVVLSEIIIIIVVGAGK